MIHVDRTPVIQDLFETMAEVFNPKDNPVKDGEDCPDCDGAGHFDYSDCCGAKMDMDRLLCHDCHEHCEPAECEFCKGTGQVELGYADEVAKEHNENAFWEYQMERWNKQ